ncbi:hypothetical protein [Yoonia vestfoldensis]|uniref:hypothetical protein n=1 Tax=Yoonia vestfoldensis TaxID=245188 RepID=UPI00036B2039|nr:hypothetical protein [Yoonia vestfoldensis]
MDDLGRAAGCFRAKRRINIFHIAQDSTTPSEGATDAFKQADAIACKISSG